MAKGGNVIGSIGPLVLYTAITLYISWTLVNKSYTLGRNSILSLLKDGKIKQVIYSANVLGMMMMGALSASYVKIASPMTFKVTGGATIVLQDILDQIMKGLLPLAAVMAIYFFMVKKAHVTVSLSARLSWLVWSLHSLVCYKGENNE